MSQDNWVELFHLIGLPKSMTLEKLTFGDLIAHSDAIIINADALKVRVYLSFLLCCIDLIVARHHYKLQEVSSLYIINLCIYLCFASLLVIRDITHKSNVKMIYMKEESA